MTSVTRVTAGFLPLLDSALLVAAKENGFAEDEHIDLLLVRERSWASIRDRLAVGHFDLAHMLAPMPIACNLGLWPLATPLIVPMALGLGGNAVTLSLEVWRAMTGHGAPTDFDPTATGAALHKVVAARSRRQEEPLRLAVVHPHSAHNFELRYWLAGCGIDPQTDVELSILAPPLMPEALATGRIDGYCAGEPWNTAAVTRGTGRIVTTQALIWERSPEKVLGVSAAWADANPEVLASLLRALYRAAEWCGQAANHPALATLLARHEYIDCPADWLQPALTGRIAASSSDILPSEDFFIPHARHATFPRERHALWFYSQMVRWSQTRHSAERQAIAASTWRADLYMSALSSRGVIAPPQDEVADRFFDNLHFDPEDIPGYLATLTR